MTKHSTNETLLTDKALQFAAKQLGVGVSDLKPYPVSGGYSLNRRAVVEANGELLFVKEVDDTLLPGDGEEERGWLRKDAFILEFLRKEGLKIVPARSVISADSNVLITTAYRKEDGWLWTVPEDPTTRTRYIDTVIGASKELERVRLKDVPHEVDLRPYLRDEIATSDGLEMLADDSLRLALLEKYDHILSSRALPESVREAIGATVRMIEDDVTVRKLIAVKNTLADQPQDLLGHCDLRPDNLTYNPQTGKVIFVDWNWASFAPAKFGSTEFLISVATKGYDVSEWQDELNIPMLAGGISSYWFNRCLKPSFNPASTVREDQAVSAAVSYQLVKNTKSLA